MARDRASYESVGGRARSGSIPTRYSQRATHDFQEHITSARSSTGPHDAGESTSRLSLRAAQNASLIQVEASDLGLESELQRAAEFNANLKEQARNAEADLNFVLQERDALQAMLTTYEHRDQSQNGELVQAKADNQHLKECLDDCKERILKVQPLEYMTDSEIAGQYRNLCESISDWTDGQFGDYNNPVSDLGLYLGREIPAKLFHEYLVRTHLMEVVQKYPTAACAVIAGVILRHVHHSVLREDLCFPGLQREWEEFVSFIAYAMRNNQPRKDEDAIGLWLIEVQRTLSNSLALKSARDSYLDYQCSNLDDMLKTLVPTDQKFGFRSEGLRKIFTEAAELAANIRLSPATYQYQSRFKVGETLFFHKMSECKVIDRASMQLIRNSDTLQTAPDGKVGQILCVVQPALVRKGKNGGHDITLVKPKILCKLCHPLVRRKKTKQVADKGVEMPEQHMTGDGRRS